MLVLIYKNNLDHLLINEDDSEKGVGKSSTKGIEHATPQDSTTSPLLVIIARHTATSNVTDCRDVGG